MTLLLLAALIATQGLLLPRSHSSVGEAACVSNYEELKASLRSNDTQNVGNLLNAFYPPNKSTVHTVRVTYCFAFDERSCSPLYNDTTVTPFQAADDSTFDTDNFTIQAVVIYQWADNALLLLLEPELINALALDLYDLKSANLSLVIDPFCSNDTETNQRMLTTLTSWLKSYAKGDTETFQDYVIYYDPVIDQFVYDSFNITSLRYLTLIWLVFTALGVTIIINARLCSKLIARRIEYIVEKTVKSVLGITSIAKAFKAGKTDKPKELEAEIKKELSEAEKTEAKIKEYTAKYLKQLSAGNVWMYILGLSVFVTWDGLVYYRSTTFRIIDWYMFFPVPYIAPIFFGVTCIISFITGCVVLCKSDRQMSKTDLLKYLLPLPILTTFTLFVLFHGFWIVLMGGAYPGRIVSTALFLIPLYFPVKLLLKVMYPIIASFLKEFNRLKRSKVYVQLKEWRRCCAKLLNILNNIRLLVIAIKKNRVKISAIVFFLSFWLLTLAVLYFAAEFLLIITDIRENPIKLVAYVTFASVVSRYLVKICKPEKKKKITQVKPPAAADKNTPSADKHETPTAPEEDNSVELQHVVVDVPPASPDKPENTAIELPTEPPSLAAVINDDLMHETVTTTNNDDGNVETTV